MESHWCVSVNHTTLDLMRYDPPGNAVPLGISAITLVCLTCIFIDISNAYRLSKPWIPCEWFTLNSLTLSLVSLAATYPSNRTTLMVSAEGQLCKLTGTVLICTCMGFLVPSIGVEKGPDSIRNVVSLSILVVTVQFNVISQMFTRAISSFVFEHLVVLFLMFVLLLIMWIMCFSVVKGKRDFNKLKNVRLRSARSLKTTNQMSNLLEWYYIIGYTCNNQVWLDLFTHCATIGLICTLCALGLLEAVVGTIVVNERKLCDRSYKSGWGLQMLLGIQILTIIVCVLAIGFRWFTMIRLSGYTENDDSQRKWFHAPIYRNLYPLPWTLSNTFYFRAFLLRETLMSSTLTKIAQGYELVTNSVLVLSLWLGRSFQCVKGRDREFNSSRVEFFRETFTREILVSGTNTLVDWILRTADYDMEKCRMKPPVNLIQLLLRCPPEEQMEMVEAIEIFAAIAANTDWSESQYRVSSFSVVILVRLLQVLIPSCSSPLTSALNDCFDLLYLIDKSSNLGENCQEDEERLMLAQDLWVCTNFKSHWFYKKFLRPSLRKINACTRFYNQSAPQAPIQTALQVIREIIKTPSVHGKCFDLYVIAKLFLVGDFDSLDELYNCFEILFAEMIYYNLLKIPDVIDNFVAKSSVEECGDRAKYFIEQIFKIKQLEDRIGPLIFDVEHSTLQTGMDEGDSGSRNGFE